MLLKTAVSILVLLPLSNADFASFHLFHYLNHSVSACSNFHGHVCGMINPNSTATHESELFYRRFADRLNSRNQNDAIMNDIISARAIGKCEFNVSTYKMNLQLRCGTEFRCYLDEFNYYYAMRLRSTKKVEDTLSFFARYSNREPNASKLLNVTSRLVEYLHGEDEFDFDQIVLPYENLHDRLSIIRALQLAIRSDEFQLRRIREIATNLKDILANRFKETQWLSEDDVYGIDRLSQYLIILEEMHVGIDFDEADTDLTTWTALNRFFASRYFEYSKRATGCIQFDVLHPFSAINEEVYNDNNFKNAETWQFYVRYYEGFQYDGISNDDLNSILLLAPMFFPLMWPNSSDTTMFAFAAIIAHELIHPFVKTEVAELCSISNLEYECIVNHFVKSCGIWAKEGCSSGKQTFEEDAPDVEGLRAAYELLRKAYTEEQIKELEYAGLGITRAQAFFYAYGMRFCSEDSPVDLVHSNNSIRINAVVSLMPQFSEAFACQPGDAEYSEPASVCYLFGQYSGFDRDYREPTDEVEEGNNNQEDNGSGKEEDITDQAEEGSGDQPVEADSK